MKSELPILARCMRMLLAALLVASGLMPLAPHAMAAPGFPAATASGHHGGMMEAGAASEHGSGDEASECEGHLGLAADAPAAMDQCCPSACFAVFIGVDPGAGYLPVRRGRLEPKLLQGLVVAAPPAFERPPRA